MKTLKKLALLVVCWLFASLSAQMYAQTTINLSSAGTLKDVANITSATDLILTGYIDARDIAFIRDNIPNLTVLDLGGVIIAEYTGEGGTVYGSAYYHADKMPERAFYNGATDNTLISSIVLPARLTAIGDSAFYGCSGLTSITNMNPQPFVISSSVFDGVNGLTCELRVPTSARSAYQAADVWKDFSTITGGGLLFSANVNNIAFGSISGTPNGFYAENTSVNLSAVPATGYNFFGWTSSVT
jgi:hypothetical protein